MEGSSLMFTSGIARHVALQGPPPPTAQKLCRRYAGAMQELCRSYAGAMQELCRSYAEPWAGLMNSTVSPSRDCIAWPSQSVKHVLASAMHVWDARTQTPSALSLHRLLLAARCLAQGPQKRPTSFFFWVFFQAGSLWNSSCCATRLAPGSDAKPPHEAPTELRFRVFPSVLRGSKGAPKVVVAQHLLAGARVYSVPEFCDSLVSSLPSSLST